MTRVVFLGVVISSSLFLWTHYEHRELSVVPLAWLISIGMCFILYKIDRSGFAKIDTVAMLKENPVLYAVWIGFYFACILAGHAFAYWIIGA
jgi:hypothetical protein